MLSPALNVSSLMVMGSLVALGACSVDERSLPASAAESSPSGGGSGAASSAPAATASGSGGSPGVSESSAAPGSPLVTPPVAVNPSASNPAAPQSSVPDASAPPPEAEPEAEAVTCSGCVELRVPVTLASQMAGFQFVFPAPGEDLGAGRIEWRVQMLPGDANAAFYVLPYVQNGMDLLYAGVYGASLPLTEDNFPAGQWVSLSVDVSAYPPEPVVPGETPGFDNRLVERVGLVLGSNAEFVGSGEVRLLVDSVGFGAAPSVPDATFATSTDGLELNAYQVPPGTTDPVHYP